MSGTSLDGLDLVYCRLSKSKTWKFKILAATTMKYSASWKHKLSTAHTLSGSDLLARDVEYGNLLGKSTSAFVRKNKIRHIDFVASHGHTIFHQPQRGFTYQLGNGPALHQALHIPVVYDFRSLDVSRGGQGAPLVPIGDRYLFQGYDCCVNLGGIANISMEDKGTREAFDFCFANMGLNYLAGKTGNEFDRNGDIASRGEINKILLKKLNTLNLRWRKKRPSLGREIFEKHIQPLLDDESIPLQDRMRTCCESITIEFEQALPKKKKLSVILTGGGALNTFMVECFRNRVGNRVKLVIPSKQIIQFKEGLIFALLGVLRVRKEINTLKSVTGARQDSSGGVMIGF